jgi:hypothetical protein
MRRAVEPEDIPELLAVCSLAELVEVGIITVGSCIKEAWRKHVSMVIWIFPLVFLCCCFLGKLLDGAEVPWTLLDLVPLVVWLLVIKELSKHIGISGCRNIFSKREMSTGPEVSLGLLLVSVGGSKFLLLLL